MFYLLKSVFYKNGIDWSYVRKVFFFFFYLLILWKIEFFVEGLKWMLDNI